MSNNKNNSSLSKTVNSPSINAKSVPVSATKTVTSKEAPSASSSPNNIRPRFTAIKSGSPVGKSSATSSPSRLSKIATDLEHLVSRPTPGPTSSESLATNSTSQLRSTLALGQLIASNRPTAGSRLVANELKQLNKTVQDESTLLRKEIANLSTALTTALKAAFEDDNESRLSTNPFLSRRSLLRRFPVYRRPIRRPAFARKSLSNASTNAPEPAIQAQSTSAPSQAHSASSNSTEPPSTSSSSSSSLADAALAQAIKRASPTIKDTPTAGSAYKTLQMLFKSQAWLPADRTTSYDGEIDSDSSDFNPGSPNVSP